MGSRWNPFHERKFHATTGTVKDEQVTMVHQAVHHCRCHLLVGEDRPPAGKLQVRRQDQTALLVAVGYHTKEQLAALTVERNVGPFI